MRSASRRTGWYVGDNADLFSHGGGGFGFLADLWWLPQLQLGIAVLTNSQDHHLQGTLPLAILDDLVHQPGSVYQDRLNALPAQSPSSSRTSSTSHRMASGSASPAWPWRHLVTRRSAGRAIRAITHRSSGGSSTRWSQPDRFFVESGVPYFEANESGTVHRYRLTEIEPGLFLAWNGETLDLRTQRPTWRNFELVRITGGPAPWQWLVLALTALVALWWLGAALASTVRRRRHRPAATAQQAEAHPRWRRLMGAAAALTALFALGTIAVLAFVPRLVDSGFLGWLELPLVVRLILHLPLALTVACGCLVVLTILGWARAWRTPAGQLRSAALVALSVALTAQLAAWHLIGWGLT